MRARKLLQGSTFEGQAHRAFFNAMCSLHDDEIPVDPLTLSARMEEMGTLKAAGGKDYIGYLVDATPTAANVEYHARIVRAASERKKAIAFLTKTLDSLKDGRANLKEIAAEVQTVMLPLALEDEGKGFVWVTKDHVEEMLHELDRRAKRVADGLLPGLPTGYHQIDQVTQGFREGEFVVIGGRDKSMKSFLIQCIFANAALQKIDSALVSAEMTFAQNVERLVGTSALVGIYDLARGSITASERERIVREGNRLANHIAIDDEAGPELGDVIARCTELKARNPRIKKIGVDYLQLIQNRLMGRRGDEEINGITRALKATGKRLEVVMYALAQCNHKDLETRTDKRPQVRDFQGASGMAQDPDFRGLIYKADEYDPTLPPVLEINWSGRRIGKFDVFLDYDPRSLAIYEKAHRKPFGERDAA